MKHSNFRFRGKLVDIKDIRSEEWLLVKSGTDTPVIIGSPEQIQNIYDKINELDSIPDLDTIRAM